MAENLINKEKKTEETEKKSEKLPSQKKKWGRTLLLWLVGAAGMLGFDVLVAFWLLGVPDSVLTPETTSAVTARPLIFDQSELNGGPSATPRPVSSISSGGPVPAGTGHYLALAKPDGYQAVQRADVCYPGIGDLALDARKHQCRFVSGSGSILRDYDYGMPVPESEAVPASWYSDAVFIGNSLEQGFMLYAKLGAGDYFATQSITLSNIYFQKVVDDGEGGMLTLLEAMARKQYGKVFVMLGINEMSYATEAGFYEWYSTLVDDIRELEPSAELYLQAMTPVTQEESESSSAFTNERIRLFNEVIRQVAKDQSAHYLDIYAAMADDSGALPPGSSFDGIHPYSQYYSHWRDYLLCHTVTENKR